jgi:hypothetical protein
MGRRTPCRAVVLLCVLPGLSAAQDTAVRDARALQRDDFATAERKPRTESLAHRDDGWTLSLLFAGSPLFPNRDGVR